MDLEDSGRSVSQVLRGGLEWRNIIAQTREWMEAWLHPAIVSGPARDPCELLDRVFADIDESLEGRSEIYGCKIDLSKCFDRCHVERCLIILLHLGSCQSLRTP